jgi:hypothetical protein
MNPKIKNSETPYFSTSPVQDQFGQLIVAFGITKREKLAMDILLEFIKQGDNPIIIKKCYELADKFFNYEDENEDNTSKIIL